MTDVLLLAASGLAREVMDADHEHRIVGILDDNPDLPGRNFGGVEVLGSIDSAAERSEDLLICAGRGSSRRSIVDRLFALGVSPERYATVVDRSVRVPSSCAIGRGSIVLAGTVLTSSVTIGAHVVIMPAVVLTHDDRLHDFVTLTAGVALAGEVTVGVAAYLGTTASVRERVTIGAGATVGMGAVVLRDVPAGETWVGNPAARMTTSTRAFSSEALS